MPALRLPAFLLVLGVAVPVVVFAGILSGALAPLGLGDPGPVVRFGTPLIRIAHHVAASLAIGSLLVGAFLTPEGRTTDRRRSAARVAAAAAPVWCAATLAGLLLTFSTISGIRLSESGYWPELADSAWPLELTRLMLIEAAIVALLCLVAAIVRFRAGLAWAFALAVGALVPLSFSGHASGLLGHEQATTALYLHLLGITVWVGGLLAVLVLWPVLGKALPVTVERFSVLALWCYVAVGGSGVLFAVLMIDGWEDLASAYFVLVLAKVVGLLALGWFGWVQRRRVLAGGVDHSGVFARFAALELAVMGAVVALGTVLSRTRPPEVVSAEVDTVVALTRYPMPPPPELSSWLTVWEPVWLFLIVAGLAVGLYLAAVVRLRRRGEHWLVGRTVCWVLGWAVFTYAVSGAPGAYGGVQFSAHMVMVMALMLVVPILLVPGAATTLALRCLSSRQDKTLGPREFLLATVESRWTIAIANPVLAGVILFGSLVLFYWSGLFEWSLRTQVGHVVMVVYFSLAGGAFVRSLLGQAPVSVRLPTRQQTSVALAAIATLGAFGLALMQGSGLLAPEFYGTVDVPWVDDPLADQQRGGVIAWGVGGPPLLILAALLTLHGWQRLDSVRTTPTSDRL